MCLILHFFLNKLCGSNDESVVRIERVSASDSEAGNDSNRESIINDRFVSVYVLN